MGNCQAAETATVLIQHPGPGNKVERIYWSVSAHNVMASHPGYYVALLSNSPDLKSERGMLVKQLKLLRPDDTLLIGHVYRLISFEDVLKEIAAKKSVRLEKLLKQRGSQGIKMRVKGLASVNPITPLTSNHSCAIKIEHRVDRLERNCDSNSGSSSTKKGVGRHGVGGGGQWRPALHSIAEVGT